MKELTPQQKKSINIFLTEKFLGKCWHEWYDPFFGAECAKCGNAIYGNYASKRLDNLDLFTEVGFFLLWNKAQREEWWEDFKEETNGIDAVGEAKDFHEDEINPQTFPIILAEYLGCHGITNSK